MAITIVVCNLGAPRLNKKSTIQKFEHSKQKKFGKKLKRTLLLIGYILLNRPTYKLASALAKLFRGYPQADFLPHVVQADIFKVQ